MRIRLAGVIVAACVCCLPVVVASANHMQATASIQMTDLGVQKDGSHRVRVDWQTSCGPNAPNASFERSTVALMIVPRRAGGKPATALSRGFEAANGSDEFIVTPGRRVFARMSLVCDDTLPAPTPEEDQVDETARATADSAERLYVPPRLVAATVTRGSYCGNVSRRARNSGVGASDFQTIKWTLQFNRATMLKSPSVAGLLKEVRLRASGKRLRLRVGPASGPLRKYGDFQATIFSPRSGKVKLWAEVGDDKTNTVTLPVVGEPCVRNPRSYYGAAVMRHANPFVRG